MRRDGLERAQARWDAMDPPDGPDLDAIRAAGDQSAPDYESQHRWLDDLEQRFGARDLWEDRALIAIWNHHHHPEEE